MRDVQYSMENSSHLAWMIEYFSKYCQSQRTLLWIWIMLCKPHNSNTIVISVSTTMFCSVHGLRATLHMSQEPWPYNCEEPWLSSKGCTMGDKKVILGSHGPSSIVWSENGHVAGPLHILLAEKEGRIWFNKICLKPYQFERITWWCLSVLESALKIVMLKIYIKKS